MSLFGEIITSEQIRQAASDVISDWSQTYLAEIGRQTGREAGDLPDFRSIIAANDNDSWLEDQLPSCVVICPGMLDEPRKHGTRYEARWALGIGVVVSARSRSETLGLVGLYTAAVRGILVQHPSVGGVASGLNLLSERYDELPNEDSRTIAAGQVLFAVDVENVIDSSQGPVQVPADPLADPGDWPQIEETIVTVETKED